MKRYLLFAGSHYYPSGGWDDFKDSFDTIETALSVAVNYELDWYHIVDTTTGKKVYNDFGWI